MAIAAPQQPHNAVPLQPVFCLSASRTSVVYQASSPASSSAAASSGSPAVPAVPSTACTRCTAAQRRGGSASPWRAQARTSSAGSGAEASPARRWAVRLSAGPREARAARVSSVGGCDGAHALLTAGAAHGPAPAPGGPAPAPGNGAAGPAHRAHGQRDLTPLHGPMQRHRQWWGIQKYRVKPPTDAGTLEETKA